MKISSIHGLAGYIKRNSNFSSRTINSVIIALGYHPQHSTKREFKELSGILKDCSRNGAEAGFTGFIKSKDTVSFYKKHRRDIALHIEQTAEDCGMDIFSMVQSFGVFRKTKKPTTSQIGRALWESKISLTELNELYNVFSWYALEEIAHTWHRYLEDNPTVAEKLSA